MSDKTDEPDNSSPSTAAHHRKPEGLTDLTKPTFQYALRRTVREFQKDECTDLAAGLTYYAVLAVFPALLAVVSLLGVFGRGESTVNSVLDLVSQVGPSSAAETLRGPVEQLVGSSSASLALFLGLVGALWTASGYVGAFGRAMNRVFEVEEGRPFWKLKPIMMLITLGGLVALAISAVMLTVSGPIASAVGDAVGTGGTALTVWNIARLPLALVLIAVAVAVLYYATPNVEQPKFRWISVGAGLAIVAWVLASLAFALYVSNFGSYNQTYGSLAGVVIFLLWIYITNLALLFGAELDAELERGRQLQAGLEAEKKLQLPRRSDEEIEKNAETDREHQERAESLRQSRGADASARNN
ncbi:MAG: YihY/virulence factor BrkB family protein [Rhodococcus sp. (in: high G+C Gram-positive bacteria)]